MSGSSHYVTKLTVGILRQLLDQLPEDLPIQIPSLNRSPGSFINADHVFIDTKENYVSIDGDISESFKTPEQS